MYKKARAKPLSVKNPFQRPAAFLTDKFALTSLHGSRGRFNRQLRSVSMHRSSDLRSFYIRLLSFVMLMLCVLLLLSAIAIPLLYHGRQPLKEGKIERPSYGQPPRQEQLLADIERESDTSRTYKIPLTLRERRYTRSQAESILQEAEKILEEGILGENTSRDEVRTRLWFPDTLTPYGVSVTYLLVPYGIISENGMISGDLSEDGTLVEIQARLSFQDVSSYYETAVMVYPPILNDTQSLYLAALHGSSAAEEQSREEAYLTLPAEISGHTVRWFYPASSRVLLILLPAVMLPLLYLVKKLQGVKDRYRMRQSLLALQYPDLVWKMSMLLGAGMTIRSAAEHIAARAEKAQKKQAGDVYQELLFTCREMQSGIAESRSYENFGKRCALPPYIKLGTLLSQRLRMGTEGLAGELAAEAAEARLTRLQEIRKIGQQAGTKLLFPMIMMLGVVIMILMVPALMSMT